MKFAIVESGGKQYRAVEGGAIEVDRLAHEAGKSFEFERVLFVADEDSILVGTPTISGVKVSATVLEHVKGPKIITFKYRPKKRIRVKTGYRHQYTRLMIDFIGKPGEEPRKTAGVEKPAKVKKEAEKPSARKPAAKKPAAKKPAPAKSSAVKKAK